MQFSKLVKNLLKYLPVLAVLCVVVIGLWVGQAIYPPAVQQAETALLTHPGTEESCFSPLLYTSYPPRCKSREGKLIIVPGTSTFGMTTERK
jgi:hypothetical protein